MLSLMLDNKQYPVNMLKFSDGAKTFKLNELPDTAAYFSIFVSPRTPVSEISEEIALLLSAIKNTGIKVDDMYLYMPYLPYGRADRIFEPGNPSPLETFLKTVEKFNFTSVVVEDPHNPKALEGCKINFELIEQYKMAAKFVSKHQTDYILAPDKGAVVKAEKLSEHLGIPLITATKVRNKSTGKITSVKLDTIPPAGSSVFIVDDILDGGGTFIPLAQTLKESGCYVMLYVTHLIASKGLEPFESCIDKICCKNVVSSFVNETHVLYFNQRN